MTTLAATVQVGSVSALWTVETYLAQFWQLDILDAIGVVCNEVFLPQEQLFPTLPLKYLYHLYISVLHQHVCLKARRGHH